MKKFFQMMFASFFGTFLALGCAFFMAMIMMVGIIGLSSSDSWKSLSTIEDDSILHLQLNGYVAEKLEKMDFFDALVMYDETPTIGLFELTRTLEAAAKDDKIKGLFLEVKNLGIGWAHNETLRREINKFKESGKFVIAFAEAFTEGTYALSTAADEIILYPRGFLEWDGVFAELSYFKKTLGKLEVVPEIFRAGKYKSAIEPFINEKMSDASREQMRALIEALWGKLSKVVAERTQVNENKLQEWANNLSVVYAQEAFEKGFVNELATYEEVEKKLMDLTSQKEEPKFVTWRNYYKQLVRDKVFEEKDDQIAVIFAEGEIVSGRGERGQISSDKITEAIRQIARDEKIKGLVLRVNSPGGSALASDVIWSSTQFLKDKKPMVASFGNVAASGGYYMSAGASHIYAEPTTITGSIGVFGLSFTTEKFWDEKLGVTWDREKSHQMSDKDSQVRPLTKMERAKIQDVIDHIYDDFLNVVTLGRKALVNVEQAHEVAQGRVWAASDAKEAGLVDEYGGLNEAVAKVAELAKVQDYSIAVYPKRKSPFEEIFFSYGDAFMKKVESFLPQSLVGLYKTIEKTERDWSEKIYTRMPFDVNIK